MTSALGQVVTIAAGRIATGLPSVCATGDVRTASRASASCAGDGVVAKCSDTSNPVSRSCRSMVTRTVTAGSVVPERSAAMSMDMRMHAASALSSSSCGRMPAFPPLPSFSVSENTRLRPLLTWTQNGSPRRVAVIMMVSTALRNIGSFCARCVVGKASRYSGMACDRLRGNRRSGLT